MSALLMLGGLAAVPAGRALAQGPGHGHPHHDNKKTRKEEIESLEQKWRQAELSGDITTMDGLLSEDFLGTTANGQVVTKAQQLDRMKNRQVEITQFDMSDVKIKLLPGVAIVNSLAMIHGTMDGKPLNGSFRYTRVYQHEPSGGWKITSFSATRVPHSGETSAAEAQPPATPARR